MKRYVPCLIAGIALSFASAGCAADTDEDAEEVERSEDRFVDRPYEWVAGSSLVEPAVRGAVRVRVIVEPGATPGDYRTMADRAVQTWLAPLRALPGGADLARGVTFVEKSPDIVVRVHAQRGRAFYLPALFGAQQRIEMYAGNDLSTLVHEMGHAFGLGDTYVEGKWYCAADQPASVMCNTGTELRADDIRAVKHEYCARTRRCDASVLEDQYGGRGGSSFRSTCQGQSRMIGINVRSGGYVDAIGPICETILTHQRVALPLEGGAGGASHSFVCPAGHYVTALRLRTGWYVDSVQVRCDDGTVSARIGGTGGASDRWYSCPAGFEAGVGLRGGEGWYVDRLGLTCDRPSTGALFMQSVSDADPPR